MADQLREKARGAELGYQRLSRYTAAFDRVLECIDTGHYLEAIAVLDSLLGDRLASRYSYVRREESNGLAVGTLCKRLLDGHLKAKNPRLEDDSRFRAVIDDIKGWAVRRNSAMHETAKVFRNNDPTVEFTEILEIHRKTALDGVVLLRRFDELDTQVRRDRGRVPGTYPNAFFPENRDGLRQLNRS